MTEESPAEAISAAISGLLEEFGRLKADVAALQRKSADIDDLTRTFDKKVGELTQSAASAVAEAQQARARVDRLTDLIRRDQAIRAASDELAELQRELESDYAAHEDVRRLARIVVRDASDGILDGRALLAQARTADVPGYWLSGASIAVVAWAAGDRERYAAAIRRALSADEARTALFMALTLRHYPPGEATRQWITRYLSALTPRELPPDLAVLLDGVTRGAFGDVSPRVLFDQLSRWYHQEADEADALAQWQDRLAGLGTPADAGEFPLLAGKEAVFATLSERTEAATAFTAASGHFRGRFAAGSPVPADLSDRVSSLLGALVDTPLAREAEIHQRAGWLKALIDSDADRAAADQATAREEADDAHPGDLVSLVTESALAARADPGVTAATVTELLAIWLSARLIGDAASRLDRRWARPGEVAVAVGQPPRTVTFSSSTDASVTPDAIDAQVSARQDSAAASIAKVAERRRGRLRLPTRAAQVALPVGVILGGVAAAPTGDPRIDFIAPAIVAAVPSGAWLAWLPRTRKRLTRGVAEQTRRARDDIGAAGEELKSFFERELAGKAGLEELQEFLRTLGPADVEASVEKVASTTRPRPAGFPDWSPFPPGQPASP
ncbi:MAG TPA: hypothetical protein VMG38_26100 [Trebonia sp.]|nr:hypothetical protein [Trebonia sp.]